MIRIGKQKAGLFEGKEDSGIKFCPLSNENAAALQQLFPYTRPASHKGHKFTMGFGDRLGLATAGHVRAHYEETYLNRELPIVKSLSAAELKRIVVVFHDAVTHAVDCYRYIDEIKTVEVDFELSIEHRSEAEKYYHVSTKVDSIPNIDLQNDAYLPIYMTQEAARQTVHIAYGLLLEQD